MELKKKQREHARNIIDFDNLDIDDVDDDDIIGQEFPSCIHDSMPQQCIPCRVDDIDNVDDDDNHEVVDEDDIVH